MIESDRFPILLERFLAGDASDAECHDLYFAVAENASQRSEFVAGLHQEAMLRTLLAGVVAPSGSRSEREEVPVPVRSSRRIVPWIAGLATAVSLIVGVFFVKKEGSKTPLEFARLGETNGDVFVIEGRERTPARSGQALLDGQGLDITGEGSMAELRFADEMAVRLQAGSVIASGSDSNRRLTLLGDGFVQVSAMPTSTTLTLVTTQAEVVMPTGQCSLSQTDESMHIEVESGEPVRLTRRSDRHTLQVNAGQMARIGSDDGPMNSKPAAPRLVRPAKVLESAARAVAQIAFSPDGHTFAGCLSDGTVQIWNWQTSTPGNVFGPPGTYPRGLVFSSDARTLAACCFDGSVRWCPLEEPGRALAVQGHFGGAYGVAFSKAEDGIISVGRDGVKFWDLTTGMERRTVKGVGGFQSARLTDGGDILTTGDWHNTIRIYNLSNGNDDFSSEKKQAILTTEKEEARFGARSVTALAFTQDRSLLAAGSSEGSVKLWDLNLRQFRLALDGHLGRVFAAEFSPEGRWLATAGLDQTVRLWDVTTGEATAVIAAPHRGKVGPIAFSPDGRWLATTDGFRRVLFWELPGADR